MLVLLSIAPLECGQDDDPLYFAASGLGNMVGHGGLRAILWPLSLGADSMVSSKPWGPQLRAAWDPLGLDLFLLMGCA